MQRESAGDWDVVETLPDVLAAEIAAGLLRSHGLSVRIETVAVVPGLQQGCRLWVRSHARTLARALLDAPAVSESDLDDLARASKPPDTL
jgi:hypothetical protein